MVDIAGGHLYATSPGRHLVDITAKQIQGHQVHLQFVGSPI